MDSRGVLRGSCSVCECDGYDGGTEGMKCEYCEHPPGKHQNLSRGPPSESVGPDLSSLSLSSSAPSTSAARFSVGTPRSISKYPDDFLDEDISIDHLLCEGSLPSPSAQMSSKNDSGIPLSTTSLPPRNSFHSKVLPSSFDHVIRKKVRSRIPRPSSSPQMVRPIPKPRAVFPLMPRQHIVQASTAPFLPDGTLCKVKGCTRPRYKESNGKLHEFCGRTHAQLYRQQKALQSGKAVSFEMKCKTPGCPLQRHLMDNGSGYYDYCSITCRDSQHCLASASAPNLSYMHAKQAIQQQAGIMLNPLPGGSHGIHRASQQEFATVQSSFLQKWAKGQSPLNVDFIFVVTNYSLQQRWQTYRQSLTIQTVEEHYHGTTLTCDITNTGQLCTDSNCGVCGISSTGFNPGCIGKSVRFQRFGHGFYLAPNSSKCHDYTQGANGYRAMLLCDVCPGNKYIRTKNGQSLRGPPQGYHSVYGQAGLGCVLNYEEIVLYGPQADAILPKYIIVYQKDGIHKLVN